MTAINRRISQLALLTLVSFSGMYARSTLGPIQEILKHSLSLTDNQIALIQGMALAAPLLILSVPLGLLIDGYSRKRILLAATICDSAATLIGGVAHSYGTLIATRCVIGLCAPATGIVAYSLLSDIYSDTTRGRATTVVVLGQIAGTAAAFTLGGQLLSLTTAYPAPWRIVMLLSGLILAVPIVLAAAISDPPRRERAPESVSARDLTSRFSNWLPLVTMLVIGMALVSLADGAALVWTAPTLSRVFSLTSSQAGIMTGTSLLVGGTAGPLLAGPLADYCQRTGGPSRSGLMIGMLLLLSAPMGLFGITPNVVIALVFSVLFVFLSSAASVAIISVSITALPNELRGISLALESGAGAAFGLGVAPLLVSSLSAALGGAQNIGLALAAVNASTCLVGALIFIAKKAAFSARQPLAKDGVANI